MKHTTAEQRFRRAAEAEGGAPISAGARVAHVRLAIESGRAIVVDLAGVPEEQRSTLIADIKELVRKASERSSTGEAEMPAQTEKRPRS
jgi:hypothetical protein